MDPTHSADENYSEREQSGVKHFALRLYLEAATLILKSRKGFQYVDCCAGPWESQSPDFADTSFGIATSVLKNASVRLASQREFLKFACLLIEEDQDAYPKLRAFADGNRDSGIRLEARNWDFTKHADEIVEFCAVKDSFSFIFIDPKGWNLAKVPAIKPLLRVKPGEVLITLMSPFVNRFIMDNKTNFSALLGEDFPALRDLPSFERESAIVRTYAELVKREGEFPYVCTLPVMNPSKDAFNFHMIYATRHPKGVEVFKQVESRVEKKTHEIRANIQSATRQARTGNLELFTPDVQYHEKSYARLVEENRQLAKEAVWKLLSLGRAIAYDACWAEALQFSGVYQKDLREWLLAWESMGTVTMIGRKAADRVLGVRKGISIQMNSIT